MIQGGGFGTGLASKPTQRRRSSNEAKNGLKNERYTVAMARTSDPHSATAQFFINVADNDFLESSLAERERLGCIAYSARVVAGKDVVDQHQGRADRQQRGGHQNVPTGGRGDRAREVVRS